MRSIVIKTEKYQCTIYEAEGHGRLGKYAWCADIRTVDGRFDHWQGRGRLEQVPPWVDYEMKRRG